MLCFSDKSPRFVVGCLLFPSCRLSKKKAFPTSCFLHCAFSPSPFQHRTGVNSHPYGHKNLHSNHPYGSFLPTSTSFLSPCNPSKYVQHTSRPWKNLPEQFSHAQKFPYGRFGASHHALPPNFNLTSFRPRAEILSFPVFSRTVSNTLPYGNAANLTGKHRTVLASTNVHPYGLHKKPLFEH